MKMPVAKKLAMFLLIPAVLMSASGCAPLLIGTVVGGIGVYAISKDTVQGETDRDYDSVWESAKRICRMRGVISQEDQLRGAIEAQIESSRIWIRIIRLTRATVRVRISARKYHISNLSLAQDIFVKILEDTQ